MGLSAVSDIDGVDCQETAAILDQSFDIQCRAGLHCAPLVHEILNTADIGGTLRFSPGIFHTEDDVDMVLRTVDQVVSAMRP